MNILIFSWRGPGHPNAGGAEQVTQEHAKAWISAGHNVTLFTSWFDGAKKCEIIDGVEVVRKGNQIITVQIFAFFWYLFGRHKNFDLVVDQFHGIPFFTPFFVRCKTLAFIHEVARDVWSMNPWKYPLNIIPTILGPKVEKFVFRYIYKRTVFLTVSDSTKDDLVNLGIRKQNVNVINNGIITPKLLPNLKKDIIKTAMFLGAIATDKGIEDVIKVFYEMDRKDDQWKYWVVGKAAPLELDRLRKWIDNFNLRDKVKVWGYVSDKKKFELLSRAHILINTSFHEGWGLVNLEANSVGTPVAGYSVHGVRDSVLDGKTGLLVGKGEVRELSSKILKLVQDKLTYEKMCKECLKWSSKFSWEKSGKQSLVLIESL